MLRKIAELTVDKVYDWDPKVIKVLRESGYEVIVETENITFCRYIIAKDDSK